MFIVSFSNGLAIVDLGDCATSLRIYYPIKCDGHINSFLCPHTAAYEHRGVLHDTHVQIAHMRTLYRAHIYNLHINFYTCIHVMLHDFRPDIRRV